jgi:hypothetical protein
LSASFLQLDVPLRATLETNFNRRSIFNCWAVVSVVTISYVVIKCYRNARADCIRYRFVYAFHCPMSLFSFMANTTSVDESFEYLSAGKVHMCLLYFLK